MELVMLRRPAVQARTGRSRSSLYADVSDGLWPPPVRVGRRTVAWPEREVAAVLEARLAGYDDDAIRRLVQRLVSDRRKATGSERS